MTTVFRKYKFHLTAAACSGLLLSAAFPDVGASWTIWFALVPLLFAIRDLDWKSGFWIGFTSGWVYFMTLIYWVAYTMRTYGYLPWPVCISILILFSTVLALFPAAFCAIALRLSLRPAGLALVLPAVWAALEYVRAYFLTGFPWGFLGHSQVGVLHLIQISDVFGVYGISYLIVSVNTALLLLLLGFKNRSWQKRVVSIRIASVSVLLAIFLVGSTLVYGNLRLDAFSTNPEGNSSVRTVIVQGNIDQALKWDPALQAATVDKYLALSRTTAKFAPELIVWPETALPFYFGYDQTLTANVRQGVAGIGTYFVAGSPSFVRTPNQVDYYNSAYLLGPDGATLDKYDKTHLVPFGEYVPLKRWLPFLGKLVAQVGDFSRGRIGDTIDWQDRKLGVLICYEAIFPYIARETVRNGASLLINITNDAWYGHTSAPHQHFSLAVFRAVENRRALVRAANTGISGFIDPAGRTTGLTPLFQDATTSATLPLVTRQSIYTRLGDVFANACLVVAMGLLAWNIIITGIGRRSSSHL